MLHFLISENTPNYKNIGRAAVEIGLRIGIPFRVIPNLNTIPLDSIVIAYGFKGYLDKYKAINLEVGTGISLIKETQLGKIYGPSRINGNIDLFGGVAHLLSFTHEDNIPRDSFGRLPINQNPLSKLGAIVDPLVENATLFLIEILKSKGIALPKQTRAFGTEKRFVSWTHDVDSPQLLTPFQILRALLLSLKRADQRESFKVAFNSILQGKPDPYWNFDDWSNFITNVSGNSTFYLYPGTTEDSPRHSKDPRYNPRKKKFVEKLHELVLDGHEIGVHHAINTDTTKGYKFASDRMEEICGVRPVGSRAHYWNTNWDNPHESWNRMKKAGLEYDTSLSPLALGYRNGSMSPVIGGEVNPYLPEKNPFVVLPSPIMDWYAVPRKKDDVVIANTQFKKIVDDSFTSGFLLLNWHVRTWTDVGPWDGLGEYARNLLIDLRDDSTSFVTAKEIAEIWRNHVNKLWLPL